MLSYQFGIVVIIVSVLSFLWRSQRVKNIIEVDALVLFCDKIPSETGGDCYTTFQYSVEGKEYITRCATGGTEYSEGTITSIYCSRDLLTKEYKKVTVADTLGAHLFINIVLMALGVISICYNLFFK